MTNDEKRPRDEAIEAVFRGIASARRGRRHLLAAQEACAQPIVDDAIEVAEERLGSLLIELDDHQEWVRALTWTRALQDRIGDPDESAAVFFYRLDRALQEAGLVDQVHEALQNTITPQDAAAKLRAQDQA